MGHKFLFLVYVVFFLHVTLTNGRFSFA